MKKIKINKALIGALVLSSLLVSLLAIQQTIASNPALSSSGVIIALSDETDIYSDEVDIDLESAPEYSENIMKMKTKYVDIFEEKLSERLKGVKSENLYAIIDKIDAILEATKESKKPITEKKEKIIAQLLALKEVIEDIVEDDVEYSIDIDLEEILKI